MGFVGGIRGGPVQRQRNEGTITEGKRYKIGRERADLVAFVPSACYVSRLGGIRNHGIYSCIPVQVKLRILDVRDR